MTVERDESAKYDEKDTMRYIGPLWHDFGNSIFTGPDIVGQDLGRKIFYVSFVCCNQ